MFIILNYRCFYEMNLPWSFPTIFALLEQIVLGFYVLIFQCATGLCLAIFYVRRFLSQILVPYPGSVDLYPILGREKLLVVAEEGFMRVSLNIWEQELLLGLRCQSMAQGGSMIFL